MAHPEVPIKVNAWVDEGIAPLVEALNGFDTIMTLDSCEGRDDSPAYVFFTSRDSTPELLTFVDELSRLLGSRLAPQCDYTLRLQWTAGTEHPMAELMVHRDYVSSVANTLTAIAASNRRTTA